MPHNSLQHIFKSKQKFVLISLTVVALSVGIVWVVMANLTDTKPAETTVAEVPVQKITASPPTENNQTVLPVVDETATPTTVLPVVDELATPTTAQVAKLPQFRWKVGARQTYRYRLHSKTEVNLSALAAGGGQWQEITADMEGLLNVRIFKRQGQKIYVGFQLSPLDLSFSGYQAPQPLAILYQTFFLAIFTLEGQATRFFLPNYVEKQDRLSVTNIVNAVQLVAPPPKAPADITQWTMREQDATGEYQAQYQLKADKIHKQKLSYFNVATVDQKSTGGGTMPLSGHVMTSQFQGVIATKQSWLQAMSGHESLEIRSAQNTLTKVAYQVSLQASDDPIDPNLAIWQADEDPDKIIRAFANTNSGQSVWEAMRLQKLREKFANAKVRDFTRKIATLNDEGQSMADIIPYLQEFEDYLSIYPEAAAQIPTLLRQENLSSRTSAMIIGALEVVGHKEAQQALTEIMLEPEPVNQQAATQAIVAAGGIKKPEPELVETLWEVTQQPKQESDTALLALGSASRNVEQLGNTGWSIEITDGLAEYLQTETNPWKQQVALDALANTRNSEVVTIVTPYLSAENERVRATAHQALSHFNDLESLEKLVTSLTTDNSLRVRRSAMEALNRREETAEAVEPVRQYLAQEPDQRVRSDIIEFLGKHKETHPEVIETLTQQLNVETSREMKKTVYKALYNKTRN